MKNNFYKFFTVLIIFCCAMFVASVQADPRVHIITVNDDESGIAASCKNDINTIVNLFDEWDNKTVARLTTSQGKDRLSNTIRNLNVSPSDVVFFYYAGHGAINKQSNQPSEQHYLHFNTKNIIWRSELQKLLQAKNAKLTVLITDCCATIGSVPTLRSPVEPVSLITNLRRLFQATGLVNVNSSTPPESAWGIQDYLEGQAIGDEYGIFTNAFAHILREEEVKDWKSFILQCRESTQSKYKSYRDNILAPEAPENPDIPADIPANVKQNLRPLVMNQKTQTVWILKLLNDDEVVSVDPPGSGVQIVQIIAGTTATRLREINNGQLVTLEKGDVIDNINGMPISTLTDYNEEIDKLPRNAEITLSVVDKNTGQRMRLQGQLDVNPKVRLGIRVYGKEQ